MSRFPKPDWSHVFIATALFALLVLGSGCSNQKEDAKTKTARPEVTLKILAIDSPSLVASAARLWSAEGQGEMEFTEISLKEFTADEFEIASQYDVVVYPCSLMAELVANDQLVEIPKGDLEAEVLDRDELLPHQRKKVLYYGSKVWSIPLGSPQLMLMYDKSTFDELDLSPPKTWSEFEAVAETLKMADKRITLPLRDSWAAELLLSRVASSIRAQGKLSTVFDTQTMQPLVATEPFVKALQSLQTVSGLEDCKTDPATAFRSMADGSSAMGITWPSKNFFDAHQLEQIEANENLVLVRLPGSPQWYNQRKSNWETRDERSAIQVDVVGGTGRCASVCKGSRHGRTAMDFACWLGSKSTSSTVSIESANVSIFRSTHLGQPSRWTGPALSYEAADQFGDIISEISESKLMFQFPRIAGQSEYMSVLADAVRAAIEQETDATECLSEVAVKWKAITERYGRDEQQKQLRRSLGYLN